MAAMAAMAARAARATRARVARAARAERAERRRMSASAHDAWVAMLWLAIACGSSLWPPCSEFSQGEKKSAKMLGRGGRGPR
eukprot:3727831-Prymnesium_polylepis.2